MMARQNHYLDQLVKTAQRTHTFNREASGFRNRDDFEDEQSYNEFQERQIGNQDALSEMYHGDISVGGLDES